MLPEESSKQPEIKYTRRQKGKIAAKIAAFVLIFCVLLSAMSNVFQFIYGRNTAGGVNGIEGFYDLPNNTVQTIVLGASNAGCGVNTPMLYEEYGICAYNLSVSSESILSSYYWTKEVYRLHSETLTTVILDVSTLRYDEDDELPRNYKGSIDLMRFSLNKLNAVMAYSDDINDVFNNLIPLFYYHDRWSGDLDKGDLTGQKSIIVNVLGHEFFYKRYIDSEDYDEMAVLDGVLDESAEPVELGDEGLLYLEKLASFCEENNIELVLIKTPHDYWNSSYHNAVQNVADEYDLTFLDFNFGTLLDELDFNPASDTTDGKHANYYGACKITAYLGQWLTENADVTDVRGEEDYAFMEEELEKYHRRVTDVMELKEETDPAEYISKAAENEDNEIFIIVKDTITAHLTDEQREAFAEMGLTVLSEQTYGSSYIGIIDEGEVIYEDTIVFDSDAYNAAVENDEEYEYETLEYSTLIDDGSLVLLESGGYRIGNIASCKIDGTEYAENTRGLNIVVYNKELKTVTDSAVFDLHSSSMRESFNIEEALAEEEEAGTEFDDLSDTLQEYVKYNRRAELSSLASAIDLEAGDDGLLTYLEAYLEEEDLAIFVSVKEEAAGSLSDEVRDYLASLGLTGLSEIEYQDSYIGVITDGEVAYEETDHGETKIEYSDVWYCVESGGYESGNTSSIEINGTEYSTASRGINIVVYDTVLGIVVDTSNFDTCATEQTIPDGEGE